MAKELKPSAVTPEQAIVRAFTDMKGRATPTVKATPAVPADPGEPLPLTGDVLSGFEQSGEDGFSRTVMGATIRVERETMFGHWRVLVQRGRIRAAATKPHKRDAIKSAVKSFNRIVRSCHRAT